MTRQHRLVAVTAIVSALALAGPSLVAQQDDPPPMGFFVTSVGLGDGANLGGLAGADAHCQSLAEAAGSGNRRWRAYLSTQGPNAVDARDRIGDGPWYNYSGDVIAQNVDDLHSGNAHLTKESILTQNGDMVNGRGDSPNMHDILTGSNLDGTVSTAEGHDACANWTSNGEGSAAVGHHDRQGGGQNPTSWNSAHGSRGCSQSDLQGTGGDGLYYCFAIDANQQEAFRDE